MGRKDGGERNTSNKRRGKDEARDDCEYVIAFGVQGHIPAYKIRKGEGKRRSGLF
jgi:hypothetical protein